MVNLGASVAWWARTEPGREALVFDGRRVTFAALQHRVEAGAGLLHAVGVRPGDILCLHTGLADLALTLRDDEQDRLKTSCCVLDGADAQLLAWIKDSRIAAIAADNHAVELRNHHLESGSGPLLPLHEQCLFKLGGGGRSRPPPRGGGWAAPPRPPRLRPDRRTDVRARPGGRAGQPHRDRLTSDGPRHDP